MRTSVALWIGIVALGLAPSCGEKENPMGEGLIDTDLADRSDSLVVCALTAASSFQFICPSAEDECQRGPGGGSLLFLGSGYGYRVAMALSFASVPVDAETVVDSARVRFTAARPLDGPADLTVHALLDTLWEGEVFFGDSLGFDPTPLAVTYEYDAEGLSLDLTETVAGWYGSEGLRALMILPQGSGPSFAVFRSGEYGSATDTTAGRPTLTVFHHPEGAADSGESRHEPGQDTYFLWWDSGADSLASAQDRITVGKGFASRALLMAEVGQIPREATIQRAKLKLWVDADQSVYDSMEVRVHLAEGDWDGPRTEFEGVSAGVGWVIPGVDSAIIDVSTLVQVWVAELVENDGFLVKSYGEAESIDFVRFFSPSYSETSARPVLTVEYSVPPPPWFRQ